MRHRKPKRRKIHPPMPQKQRFWPKTVAGWFWSALLGLITLAGGWALVRPVVRVDPYIRLNPNSPFSERFKVENDGYFSIYDVEFNCRIVKATTFSGSSVHDIVFKETSRYRKSIVPADSVTMDCPVDETFALYSSGKRDPWRSAQIQVSIRYRPSLYPWHKQRIVGFTGQLDGQNNVQWTY
jgi:hypothetical protein